MAQSLLDAINICQAPLAETKFDTPFKGIYACSLIYKFDLVSLQYVALTYKLFIFSIVAGEITIFDEQYHFACGVQCQYKDIFWGHTQQDLQLFYTIGVYRSIIVFPAIIIAMINHIMEIKFSEIKYSQRSTIFHLYIPFILSILMFETFMYISGNIGRDWVACSKDLNDIFTVTLNNRSRGHFPCTFSAIFIDILTKLRQFYSIMFCLLLWKQFFAPLRSLSEELQEKLWCKPCCCLVQTCTQNCICTKCIDTLKHCNMESTRISESDAACACLCSKTFHVHCFAFLLTAILTTLNFIVSDQQPMILLPSCFASLPKTANPLWSSILDIPFYLEVFVYGTFFPNAAYLLCKFMKYNQRGDQQNVQVTRLGKRLLGFYVFLVIEFSSGLLFRIFFAIVQDDLDDAILQRFSCMYNGQSYQECLTVGYHYPQYLTVIQSLAVWPTVSMVFLTLNQTAFEKWSIIFTCLYQTIYCKLGADKTMKSLKQDTSNVKSTSTENDATQTRTSSTHKDNSTHDHENATDTQTRTIELLIDTSN